MKKLLTVTAIIFLLVCTSVAVAQEEIDMATYTCADLFDERESDVLLLIFWIDGYLSGKTGDKKVNADALSSLAEKLIGYCDQNRQVKILDAVNNVQGKY